MADVIQLPKLTTDRKSITLYRTPFPKVTDDGATQQAKLHGVDAQPEDAGSRIVFRDRRATLEVFRASDSIRWSTLINSSTESNGDGRPPALIDDAAAKKRAVAFLKERQVATKGAAIDSVTHAMLARATRDGKDVQEFPIAVHVNFRYAMDGLPVLGPGAKIQVTFTDARGTPAEMYRFWRQPKAESQLPLLPPKAVLGLLRADADFAELGEGAKVVYRNPRLGYYALPPRESQGALIPVWAFDGTLSTKELPRNDFTRYVVAVKYTPEDAKRVGAAFRNAGPVFS